MGWDFKETPSLGQKLRLDVAAVWFRNSQRMSDSGGTIASFSGR